MDTDGSAIQIRILIWISGNRDAGDVMKWCSRPAEGNSNMFGTVKQREAGRAVQSENEMSSFLDLRWTIPPFTLLKLTHGFRKLQTGEIMKVIGTSPDSKKDILNVLKALPCEIICVGDTNSCYFIHLKKVADNKAHRQGKNGGRNL